jgi:hypothetical protein
MRRTALPLAALAALSLAASGARAGDPFEIQVYDGTANAPGVPGLELHLNDWATGNREATPPEAPLHGQFHATLEPSLGITPFWELGAYLQGAVRTDDGMVDWAGVKLRSKFVTPPSWSPHWRLGMNFELSYLPPTYDHDRWGSEIRPIVAWHDADWLFVFNPILDQAFAGSDASQGPSFQPAVRWRVRSARWRRRAYAADGARAAVREPAKGDPEACVRHDVLVEETLVGFARRQVEGLRARGEAVGRQCRPERKPAGEVGDWRVGAAAHLEAAVRIVEEVGVALLLCRAHLRVARNRRGAHRGLGERSRGCFDRSITRAGVARRGWTRRRAGGHEGADQQRAARCRDDTHVLFRTTVHGVRAQHDLGVRRREGREQPVSASVTPPAVPGHDPREQPSA